MEIQRIRLIHFTGPWKIPFLNIAIEDVQLRNDADGKLQKVGGQCLILSSDQENPSNIVRGKNLVTVSSYRSANIVQKCYKLP